MSTLSAYPSCKISAKLVVAFILNENQLQESTESSITLGTFSPSWLPNLLAYRVHLSPVGDPGFPRFVLSSLVWLKCWQYLLGEIDIYTMISRTTVSTTQLKHTYSNAYTKIQPVKKLWTWWWLLSLHVSCMFHFVWQEYIV